MAADRLDEVYIEQLRNQGEGRALYFKVGENHMKPGTCGYFTETRQWRPIVHLGDAEPSELAAEGWDPPTDALRIVSQDGIEWPIKYSASVTDISTAVEAGASVPGAPVLGKFSMNFRTGRGAGAVLLSEGVVNSHQLERDSLAYQWVKKPRNMQKLLADWETELSEERRTLWLITSTYVVDSCALAVLRSETSCARIGMDIQTVNVAQASASASWWRQGSDQTWNKYKKTDTGPVVVFMSGVAFRTGRFRTSKLFPNVGQGPKTRAGSSKPLHYPLNSAGAEDDPWVADIIPYYDGERAGELRKLLDDLANEKASQR
ncbi:hypothetical protein B0A48_00111 [Cryoendolithus antarcticus]|uniref:Uncharacterized protein n=1 Tax=Cryoendolithus antarcticus TaxID=1507870 RepID=A0A1V8TTS4_9PEZI|nr:hypothetical protein B0A48_00111 [Cryoendolithus antarcticus]